MQEYGKYSILVPTEKLKCSGSAQPDQKSNGTEVVSDSVSLYPEYICPLCLFVSILDAGVPMFYAFCIL